jgi:pyocin large subunit-like protein
MLPDPYNPQALNRYSYCLNNPVKYTDPSGHEPISATLVAVVILKVTTAAIDYGWTGHDIMADMDVISDPNTDAADRKLAATDMALCLVTEAIEPDELFIINLPLDDLARKGLMKRVGKYYDNVPEALSKPLFKNDKLLVRHYEKHVLERKEFGDISIEEYLGSAQKLVTSDAGGDILRKTRKSDGEIVHYNRATNEFAVTDKDGNIKTYFKPEEGEDYYRKQE